MSVAPAVIHDPDAPSKDECTMAFLAHLLQVFCGFIAPLVIFCVKQDSRFVKFHALQALLWQACYMAVFVAGMIIFFITMLGTMAHGTGGPHPAPPTAFFILFPFLGVLGMGGWIVNLVLGLMYGLKANRGEWAAYPLIGKWLLRKYYPGAATGAALTR